MSSSPRNTISDLRIVSTEYTVGLPLVHEGFYSYVCRMQSSGTPTSHLPFSKDTMVKIFRENRGINSNQEHEGLEEVIASLSRSCNGSKSAAFVHKYITPSVFVDIHEISTRGTRSTKAVVTPWYNQGDVLGFINKHPDVSKITLVVQVSKALEHLHKFDIIHGNIYPGNILVTDEGYATITDVSVRTLACQALFHRRRDMPLQGSNVYESPELLSVRADSFIERRKPMDSYSFGLTMFTIFTGKTPFLERNPLVRLAGDPMEISRPMSNIVCEELWQLWRSCWARDPAARPSMSEIVEALEDIQLYH